jgi:hypothetical protein
LDSFSKNFVLLRTDAVFRNFFPSAGRRAATKNIKISKMNVNFIFIEGVICNIINIAFIESALPLVIKNKKQFFGHIKNNQQLRYMTSLLIPYLKDIFVSFK